MADAAVTLLKITVRTTFLIGAIMMFIIILNIFINAMLVSLNGNILSDIFAMVSMWMPFNLGTVLVWLLSVGLMFLGFRLLMVAFNFLNKVLGHE